MLYLSDYDPGFNSRRVGVCKLPQGETGKFNYQRHELRIQNTVMLSVYKMLNMIKKLTTGKKEIGKTV